MDDRTTLPAGALLDGKYRIDGVIGTGAGGITYRAFNTHLATPIAIKEYFPAGIATRDATGAVLARSEGDREAFEQGRRAFMREAQTLAQFAHRGIVEILNVLATDGTVYMVMRLETGDNLRIWREKLGRAPTQAEVDRLLSPLLDALEVMHASNFLHRDIAPESIVIRPDGSPVLLGFGATRRVSGAQSQALTRVFTAGFSPPEQYVGDGKGQGPWTDIYALSGTLYWLLSGDAPPEAAARMASDPMLPASAMAGDSYRAGFLAALDHGTRLPPGERPQSVAEWRAELWRQGVPVAASASVAPIVPVAQDAVVPPARRSQAGIAAAATIVLVLFGGLMALAGLRGGTAPGKAPDAAVSTSDTRLPTPSSAGTPVAPGTSQIAGTSQSAGASQSKAGETGRIALGPLPSTLPTVPSPSTTLSPPPKWDSALVTDIRTALNRVGCHTDATSLGWMDADQKALESFARHTGGVHSFLALDRDIVRVVSAHSARVCPVTCAAGEISAGDRCVRMPALDCSQIASINERAQIGLAGEEELQLLRSGRCKRQ